MAFTALFKITRGPLSVNSHGLLRSVMRRTRRSLSESFIPLQTSLSTEYLSFFSRTISQWNKVPASVFSEHCSLDTFKAHVSCLNHLPVYNPIKLTFFFLLFIYLFTCVFVLLTSPANNQMWGVSCTWLASQLANQQTTVTVVSSTVLLPWS